MKQPDPNPIIDEGAPTSTGGMTNAARICDMLGIRFEVQEPRSHYMHGWGIECSDAKPIKCTWGLTVMDTRNLPVTFTFDLVEGDSPLIVGLDFKQYADTYNRDEPRMVKFKRPHDVHVYTMYTYIAKDLTGNMRLRLEIVPHEMSSISTLMTTTDKRRELNMAKRIHRFGHASAGDMIAMMKNTGYNRKKIKDACDKVYAACAICTASGRPSDRKKISTTHVNAAFNDELQADFMYVNIREKKHEILNMIDVGTRYGERTITESRTAEEVQKKFESCWFYRHGAPNNFSADHELCRPVLQRFLSRHAIKLNPRPSRSSNKVGRIERNNGVFRSVIDKLQKSDTKANPHTLVARASFFTNLIHGSKLMNSFQLARGYAPSILGIPRQVVTQELLDAHIDRESTRAMERVMKANAPNTINPERLPKGTHVFVYYKSSKQNERNEWIPATVINAGDHIVECRRKEKGPPMTIGYNDIRLRPTGELTNELMKYEMDDDMHENLECENEDIQPHVNETNAETHVQTDEDINGAVCATPDTNEQPLMMTGSMNARKITDERQNIIERTELPEKDIGDTEIGTDIQTGDIRSDRQKIMREIHGVIGNTQVTLSKLECAPSWMTAKALQEEHDNNWAEAYIEVEEKMITKGSNVICSHVVYKIKTDEDGQHKMKARICPHGNRDDLKDDIRKDSATAQFHVIRLLLSIAATLGMRLGVVDISGAYMQSGPIKRQLYVRPPREWVTQRGMIWKLLKLPYGVTEAGRQWAMVMEEWLTKEAGMDRVNGISQLFIKRRSDDTIKLILAKVTDDLLFTGDIDTMEEFVKEVSNRFKVSKAILNSPINFNGTRIEQDEKGNITMNMNAYMGSIKPLDITRARRKQPNEKATPHEYKDYRSLAGSIIWAGNGAMPQAAYVGSFMQQVAPRLRVSDMTEANKMLKEIKDLNPQIMFRKLNSEIISIDVWTFSDASFNIVAGRDYGQTGIVTGLKIQGKNGESTMHMIDWTSNKQRRVSHSSYGAEILACSDADDRGYYIKQAIIGITKEEKTMHILHVDSRGLFDTISTLHDGKEYRLRQTVQRIRDSFESGDIDILRWIPTGMNIADTLTKRCTSIQRKFNQSCANGHLTIDNDKIRQLHSKEWK